MHLEPGKMLAHYRLIEQIGEGGMGVVWKALDTNLDREVAIKALPEHFADDGERLARFEREAKLLASLNHTHIAAVFGLHQANGLRFLAMELVPGESLDAHLAHGAMRIDESLQLALEVAEALEAAHENGIIHRDLKPANIQRGPDGHVKVLDFGLAKTFEKEGSAAGDSSMSPTVTTAGTLAGVILGTAAYMSPEQARGRPVDKRTDIWSFGVVLYECLTGRKLFGGESIPDALGAILHKEPDWTALPAETPVRVRELLARCLERDARKRLRDIGDARLELEAALGLERSAISGVGAGGATLSSGTARRRTPFLALAAAVAVGAVVGVVGWTLLAGDGSTVSGTGGGAVRLSLNIPEDQSAEGLQLSPDGRVVAYRGRPRTADATQEARFYYRFLDGDEVIPVPGSDRALNFRFSPDSRWAAFIAPASERSSQFRLMKAPVDRSTPPQVLVDWDRGWDEFEWLSTDEILVLTEQPRMLLRVPAGGGSPGPPVEIRPQGFGVSLEHVLPDQKHVLGTSASWSDRGWTRRIAVVNIDSGEAHLLLENGDNPRWASTGHLLFSRQDTLLAAPFDPAISLDVGSTVAVSDGLLTVGDWSSGDFQISATGTLAFFPGGVVGNRREIVYLRGDGAIEPWAGEQRSYVGDLKASPDGAHFSVTITNPNGLYEIWLSAIEEPRLRRFVADPGRDCHQAIWSHDSSMLAYSALGQGTDGAVFVRRVDGGEAREVFHREKDGDYIHPTSFTADGKQLFIDEHGSSSRILVRDLDDPDGEARVLLESAWEGHVSPDGAWLAYSSDASGRNEIYVRRLGSDGALGPELPVTTERAFSPEWLQQKSPLRLSYVSNGETYIVDIRTGSGVSISSPEKTTTRDEVRRRLESWGWLPDGRRFALLAGMDEEPPREARIVLDWFRELETRAGSR